MSDVDSLVMLREFGYSLGKCLCILLVGGGERHVASMGAKRNVYRILVRNSERKTPHRRPTRTSGTNSNIDLNEI